MPGAASSKKPVDIFVIGGGVNGVGIARDAVGRGLSVALAEMNDLAWATSSASTKLFHGGLRYLEYYEFRLVREALIEREVLLNAMPHISWPMRFVLPHHKGLRPWWLIRIGLFLYDHLGGRKILPATRTLDLTKDPAGKALKSQYRKAFEYSDCWVQDARLVTLMARDSAERGVRIMTRTKVTGAEQISGSDGKMIWKISLGNADGPLAPVFARALVNAGGPWAADVITGTLRLNSSESVRLVRGSHIVTKKLFDHDRSYFFQGNDGRIIFAIPYEQDYTLIGTTDKDHKDAAAKAECTPEEAEYLCRFASEYFEKPLTQDDIVWTYSGVRPLYDDGASSATAATRDYVLSLREEGAPLLSVFGGKITTHRKLAEAALHKLSPFFPQAGGDWTARSTLPGGAFKVDAVDKLISRLQRDFAFLDAAWATRLFRCYGADCWELLGAARSTSDLGQHFGANLYEAEVRWLTDKEFAKTAEDIVWRRTKLGLKMQREEIERLDQWLDGQASSQA
ncbi:glycerol-3-phosphate dehydrogenase [Martelella mediterranea]|uniref:Glycerol-3-phosphate dehydrogenase n=1 Tax=Martelella mediterranea TaxID=293089 RepID=A0A4V2V4A2_9HYPH|nr:glycerol-3-phosphate dehydrogenase [Martelella mediterranea]TCT37635.1 homodimeric glycerol 3-phosphate dehydrogenase (quinone) [Martelella mediterranea]